MTINIRCANPDCQKPLRVKDESAGKRVKCPGCGHLVLVAVAATNLPPTGRSDAHASRSSDDGDNHPIQPQRTNSGRSWLGAAIAGALVGSLLMGGLVFWWTSTGPAMAKNEAESAKAELLKAKAELSRILGEVETTRTELANAKAEAEADKSELAKAKKAHVEFQRSELAKCRAETESVKAELTMAQSEGLTTKAELSKAKTEIETARADLAKAKTEVEATKAELAKTKPEAKNTNAEPEPKPGTKNSDLDLRKIQPVWGIPPTKRGFVGGLDRLESTPKDFSTGLQDLLEKVTGERKDQIFLTFVPFFAEMSLLFDKNGKFQKDVAVKYIKRLDSIEHAEYRLWLDTFNQVLGQDTQKGPVALYLLPVDRFFAKDRYDPDCGKKYVQRLKSVPKDAIQRWLNDVNPIEATTVGAAMNIVLLDEFFENDSFNATRYAAALKKLEQPPRQTGLVVLKNGSVSIETKLDATVGKDTVRPGSLAKVYEIKLEANKTYQIDMASGDFDTYLRLEDAGGKQLAEDDDSGGGVKGLDAQITFSCMAAGTYRIICTTFDRGGQGNFKLQVKAK